MKSKAAVLRQMGLSRPYSSSQPLTIEELDLQPPGPSEVLVKIHAAGLCHSDLSVIEGNRPRPLPMALGHEAAGEIVECGPHVRGLQVGDHVVFSFVPTCGHCHSCATGRPALCQPGAAANASGELLGRGKRLMDSQQQPVFHHLGVSGFAEYVVASRHSVVKIDKQLPFTVAALFGCAVITGVGAVVNTANVRLGQTVLITGLGGVGFAALLGALASGASRVIVADISAEKRQKALALGAHVAIDPADPRALEQVKDISRGGVDVGLEFAGVVAALEFTFQATARGGKTITGGLPASDKRMALSPLQLVAEERTLQGSYLGSCIPSRDIPAYITLYQDGRLPVDALLTHTFPLGQINAGFDRLAAGDAIRQVITF
ncbi:MAG: zinc-dependent alcohol dehydrogenase family protein [Rudanella sp.]|nr:zinc-dependent alcohol dehydrogenase family protein [Rudanella sp.]